LSHSSTVAIRLLEVNRTVPKSFSDIGLLQAMPNRTTPNGWQLRRITNQHQTTARRECRQQRLHQRQIEHRHLIDHQEIQLQRSLGMARKSMGTCLKPAMQSAAWQPLESRADRIAQPSSRLTRGCGQTHTQAGMMQLHPRQQFHDGAGFACARSAADQHH
jgi:hypothetical protein